jgi:hypothetical protein
MYTCSIAKVFGLIDNKYNFLQDEQKMASIYFRHGENNNNKGVIILSASTSYIKREMGGDHTTGAFTRKERDQNGYMIPRNYHLELKPFSWGFGECEALELLCI